MLAAKLNMSKKIFVIWLQGWANAPYLQRKCLESWRYYNPTWEVIRLSESNVYDYVPEVKIDLPGLDTNKVHTSDILRTYLIKKYGGIWADSTLFCNKPVDEWIPSGPFLYSNPFPGRAIADWFIKSDPDCVLMENWLKEVITFWKWRIRFTDQQSFEEWRAWHHYSFQIAYEKYSESRAIWDAVGKIDCSVAKAHGPHKLTPYQKFYNDAVSREMECSILSKEIQMYKLTRHLQVLGGSSASFLLNTIP